MIGIFLSLTAMLNKIKFLLFETSDSKIVRTIDNKEFMIRS